VGVNQSYAASEAMPLALPCRYGWLRLNSDWFLVEPIDPEGRTWYGRSLASRGKDGQCLSAYHPVVRRCSEVMVSAISCTKLDVASKGPAWPAPSIWCVLAVGMVAARERVRRMMLLGLRAR
jgi:hypothetical protein